MRQQPGACSSSGSTPRGNPIQAPEFESIRHCFFIQYQIQFVRQCGHVRCAGMNQQQSEFIDRAMQQLRQVIQTCSDNGNSASLMLGRKRVGKHRVVVTIIAEVDQGFAAPLNSHASRLGAEPDYSIKTKHHNKHRSSRWHKPIF